MSGVDNAVKDRFGQGGITHDFIPTPDWHLGDVPADVEEGEAALPALSR